MNKLIIFESPALNRIENQINVRPNEKKSNQQIESNFAPMKTMNQNIESKKRINRIKKRINRIKNRINRIKNRINRIKKRINYKWSNQTIESKKHRRQKHEPKIESKKSSEF